MNNNKPLFVASFLTLIAAGMGFAIRGGILGDWETQFGFTKSELGGITGGGLVGFGIMILLFSTVTDKVGYKPLLIIAFLLHVLSAVVTLAATPVYEAYGKDATLQCLYWGMFIFSLANGMCETVINPLVATLYPKQKTHYLNILHAGWPGGLVIGGLLAYLFCSTNAKITHLRWEIPMMLFLIPTVIYGLIVLKEKFPISEARAAGATFSTMLATFASPILLLLLLLHALVGYVELGTDSWITDILKSVIASNAFLLFVYTSTVMFILRFFAGPIVEKINPVGLLMATSLLGAAGLYMLGHATTGLTIFLAASIYAVGKTFLWPTMLGIVGERFPQGGALTMGAIGGVGMLSAGLLGGPGIGYKQDYYASQKLEQTAPDTYSRYKADKANSFLFFPAITGLDGQKVGSLMEKVDTKAALTPEEEKDAKPVQDARIFGGRMALRWTALVPLMMAVGYFILVVYFRAKGGYQVEVLHGQPADGERYTGGVEAPLE